MILCFLSLTLIAGCKQPVNNSVKKDSVIIKTVTIKKSDVPKKAYPLTDSGQLMLHLDSLPKLVLPYNTANEQFFKEDNVSLFVFKSKKLINLPIQLIPTEIGGDGVDHWDDRDADGKLPDSIKETFNLVDTTNYKITAKLAAITPKFIVLVLRGVLVTLNYKLNVIDAINTSSGNGNSNWQTGRETTINKNLTLKLHHFYSVRTDEAGHYDYENEYAYWFIDTGGHIKKQPERHLKKHKS